MTRALILVAAGLLASCTASPSRTGPDFTPSYSRITTPNNAPRGSEEFCRTYGKQTSTTRALSSAPNGRGPRGSDRVLAAAEGERAYERCLSGRTN
jgi:hypothetical protein